jgi:hypothetical protein
MSRRIIRALFIAALMSSIAALALAQQPASQREPVYVDHKEFKSKIIELKHRDPQDLVYVLNALGSGFKGAGVSASREFKSITVRDFPENIAVIEEALKRLDVPPPPKTPSRDVEVIAYILVASNQETTAGQYPAPLRDVINQLQNTLGFRNYQLLTPIVQRTNATHGSLSSNGTTPFPGGPYMARYELRIGQIATEYRDQPNSNIVFHDLNLALRGNSNEDYAAIGEAKIATRLTIKENEKVVVGTANLKDKALILVVMAKYMN